MAQVALATDILFNLMGGLGLFFLGVGVLWYVSLLKEEREKKGS